MTAGGCDPTSKSWHAANAAKREGMVKHSWLKHKKDSSTKVVKEKNNLLSFNPVEDHTMYDYVPQFNQGKPSE